MNISEVARQVGLPVKTVRYYADIGLVAAARTANGYRSFRPRDLHRLAFVGRARSLGFSIGECRALLQLYDDPGRASASVKALAEAHLAQIDAKLAELAEMRATLADLVTACAGDQRPDCPILRGIAPLTDPETGPADGQPDRHVPQAHARNHRTGKSHRKPSLD